MHATPLLVSVGASRSNSHSEVHALYLNLIQPQGEESNSSKPGHDWHGHRTTDPNVIGRLPEFAFARTVSSLVRKQAKGLNFLVASGRTKERVSIKPLMEGGMLTGRN